MRRRIATATIAVLLATIVCVRESSALVEIRVDRDYTVEIGEQRFGVQDYSGWGWGSEFHGTTLYLGPLGKRPLPVGSRVALAIAGAVLLALAALVAYLLSFKAANKSETR